MKGSCVRMELGGLAGGALRFYHLRAIADTGEEKNFACGYYFTNPAGGGKAFLIVWQQPNQ